MLEKEGEILDREGEKIGWRIVKWERERREMPEENNKTSENDFFVEDYEKGKNNLKEETGKLKKKKRQEDWKKKNIIGAPRVGWKRLPMTIILFAEKNCLHNADSLNKAILNLT